MIEINIKPLSVNQAWKGRRFKTDFYKVFELEFFYKLPDLKIPKGKLKISFVVGYKNALSDIDNFLKPCVDILQKKYLFNDNMIYELNVKKEVGKEFIKFEIEKYEHI